MTADALFTLSDDSKRLMSTVEEEGQYVHVKTFMSEMEDALSGSHERV